MALERNRGLESLDRDGISNLRVLNPGSKPMSKSGPNRYKLLLIGTFVGLVVGLGLAFARSVLDHTVRSVADVQRVSGLLVLTTVRRKRGMPRRRSR